MARNETQADAMDVRTERLANQAVAPGTLASQSGSAQANRTEITQVIQTAGVSSITGTANQVSASAPSGAVTLSLPATVSVVTAYQIGGQQVIAAPISGWQTFGAGSAERDMSGNDTATISTAKLAEAVKALIDDLLSHGLIKA